MREDGMTQECEMNGSHFPSSRLFSLLTKVKLGLYIKLYFERSSLT
jgi:hypothetical protein